MVGNFLSVWASVVGVALLFLPVAVAGAGFALLSRHHLVGYALLGIAAVWMLAAFFVRRRRST